MFFERDSENNKTSLLGGKTTLENVTVWKLCLTTGPTDKIWRFVSTLGPYRSSFFFSFFKKEYCVWKHQWEWKGFPFCVAILHLSFFLSSGFRSCIQITSLWQDMPACFFTPPALAGAKCLANNAKKCGTIARQKRRKAYLLTVLSLYAKEDDSGAIMTMEWKRGPLVKKGMQ